MQFDDQLRRFVGTEDLADVSRDALASGIERMQVEFGLETDRGRKFAIWSILFILGAAPDLEDAFEEHGDRDAARTFMDMFDKARG
jgi:hypothetical protein